MDLFDRIDLARQRWDVLKHPFYRRWESGELSRDELAFYAGEYRHAVVAIARSASAAGAAGHAQEEAEHVGLWDAFADALGAPLDRPPTTETRDCAAAWGRDERGEALAVLYAVESAQPAISETKLRGLVAHYGFEPGSPPVEYFALHSERDVAHAHEARALLAASMPADDSPLATAAEDALRANWSLLDGVERAA